MAIRRNIPVHTNAESQFSCFRAQRYFKLPDNLLHLENNLLSKVGHVHCMFGGKLRKTSHGDIAITNGFHFENLVPATKLIKGSIDGLQQ